MAQKDGVKDLLLKWDIEAEFVGIVFDTTASNIGIRAGCSTLLEKELGHAVLWLACRHHVYELHIR